MDQQSPELSISLADLLGFVVRGLVVAALVGALVGGFTYVRESGKPAVYRAEATLLVVRATTGLAQFGLTSVAAPPIDMSAYRAAAASDGVLADALRNLGVSEPTEAEIRSLRSRVGSFIAGDSRDSSLLGIDARAEAPHVAADRANAVAAALVAWDRRRATEGLTRVITALEQQILALGEQIRAAQAANEPQAQVDGLTRLRADQQQQLAYARALGASAEGLLSIMQPAGTTPRQIAPRPLMSAAVATLLAVVLSYIGLLLVTGLAARARSGDDLAASVGLPLLAEYPRATGPKAEWRLLEASNYLRSNLLFRTADEHPKVFLVASARDREGKTTVSCQLAESLARNGYKTLLVDGDLRSPSIGAAYGFTRGNARVTTVREWLTPTTNGGRMVLRVRLAEAGELFIVPQFEAVPDAAEALSRGFAEALALWDGYDAIVIDSPPLLAVADAMAIAPHCTGTVLVVDPKRTSKRGADSARGLLRNVGAEVLGIVTNKVARTSSGMAYGGPYGDAYGAPTTARLRGVPRLHGDTSAARTRGD